MAALPGWRHLFVKILLIAAARSSLLFLLLSTPSEAIRLENGRQPQQQKGALGTVVCLVSSLFGGDCFDRPPPPPPVPGESVVVSASRLKLLEPLKDLRELTDFQHHLFERQNMFREVYGEQKMEWDKNLAAGVKHFLLHSDQHMNCKMVHSNLDFRGQVGAFDKVGENLYTRWGSLAKAKHPTGNHVADSWFNEVACYTYGPHGDQCTKAYRETCLKHNNFKPDDIKIGHFTQLMWETATHVGCDVIECTTRNPRQKRYLAGCWYGSTKDHYGGNVKGDFPFSEEVADRLGLQRCSQSETPTTAT